MSDEATILDYADDYTKEGATEPVLRQGTNGWTCFPDAPSTPGNDPWCLDRHGLDWWHALARGVEPQLTAPGLSYMLQGGSDASATDPTATEPAPGDDWVAAPPHVMFFATEPLDAAAWGTDHHSGRPFLMWAGTPYEHLMMPVPGE